MKVRMSIIRDLSQLVFSRGSESLSSGFTLSKVWPQRSAEKVRDLITDEAFFYFCRCARVLAAAVFAALLVRPSRKTCEAALAAAADVRSTGALLWVSALPATVLTALLVEVCKTLDAALAARDPVPFFIN